MGIEFVLSDRVKTSLRSAEGYRRRPLIPNDRYTTTKGIGSYNRSITDHR